jgi:uncharacterized protein (DUF1330 family)
MSAYFIISVTINNHDDRSLYDEYLEAVKPIAEHFGGKYVIRSKQVIPVSGAWLPDKIVVIEFPTKKQLEACFCSDEYRSIKAPHESSVVAEAVIVEQLPINESKAR